MEIKETNLKVCCDILGCKNLAKYFIENKGFLLDKRIYICEHCIEEIYSWYSKKTKPKAISNMLNKKGIVDIEKKQQRRKKERSK